MSLSLQAKWAAIAFFAATGVSSAQVHKVLSWQWIGDGTGSNIGGFEGVVDPTDQFGHHSVAGLGDLNGDGIGDLAVSASGDHAVWVLFLNSDGTVQSETKISDDSAFGYQITSLSDISGDGRNELVVAGAGVIWVLFLGADGTVTSEVEIGIGTAITSLAAIGDLDADGIPDLAMGNSQITYSFPPPSREGYVRILFLNGDGTVRDTATIDDAALGGLLEHDDGFGDAVSPIGDLNDDGVLDLAVGASGSWVSVGPGRVWILFMNTDGSVQGWEQIVHNGIGSFELASPEDLDGDGVEDIVEYGETQVGVYNLHTDGTVKSGWTIPWAGVSALVSIGSGFGMDVIEDINGDGHVELVLSGGEYGEWGVWVLFLGPDTTPPWFIPSYCYPAINIPCASPSGVAVAYDPQVQDDADNHAAVVCDPPSGSIFMPGITTVTCSATDYAGNTATCQFNVTISADTMPPFIYDEGNIIVRLPKTGPSSVVVNYPEWHVFTFDDCDPAPSVVYSPASGSTFQRGSTTVTYTSTDASGNQALGTFEVIVGSVRRR